MADNKNKVILQGNLGAAPEIRLTPNNRKVANFSLATNEEYQNTHGETVKEVHWHQLVAWGKLADKVEAELVKGSLVQIEGRLGYRSYEDKEGKKRYMTEITVLELKLIKTSLSVDLPFENGARKTK